VVVIRGMYQTFDDKKLRKDGEKRPKKPAVMDAVEFARKRLREVDDRGGEGGSSGYDHETRAWCWWRVRRIGRARS
jgi:hypothetical protein